MLYSRVSGGMLYETSVPGPGEVFWFPIAFRFRVQVFGFVIVDKWKKMIYNILCIAMFGWYKEEF